MTDAKPLVPAALYLRMSTEHQQYSLENQSTAIQKYADSRGFEVVQTYSDAARSGLVLRRRVGLRQLLQDVVAGSAPYRVILVYDVMRARRDYAMLAMLFGCGFRRSELVGLELDKIQMRQGHWAVV